EQSSSNVRNLLNLDGGQLFLRIGRHRINNPGISREMSRGEQRAHALDQPSGAPNVSGAPIFSSGKSDGILLGIKVVCPRALVTRWIKRVICRMMAQPL